MAGGMQTAPARHRRQRNGTAKTPTSRQSGLCDDVRNAETTHARFFTTPSCLVPAVIITRTHARTHSRTHSRTHTLTHAHPYTHTHARTHALTHAHPPHTRTHTLTHAHTHTRTHTLIHAHPHTHARTHARTHTHTHTHTQWRSPRTRSHRRVSLLLLLLSRLVPVTIFWPRVTFRPPNVVAQRWCLPQTRLGWLSRATTNENSNYAKRRLGSSCEVAGCQIAACLHQCEVTFPLWVDPGIKNNSIP